MSKTLLTFVEEIYEDLELWYPLLRLQEAGYAMRIAAPEIRTYSGKHGYPAASDLLLKEAHSVLLRQRCVALSGGGGSVAARLWQRTKHGFVILH